MELTIHEAAALLGKSPRTVRAHVATDAIPARKSNGRWMIASDSLPLTEVQRRSLPRRAQEARDAVERALPQRLRGAGRGTRSVRDFEPFARLVQILGESDPGRTPWHMRSHRTIALALRSLAVACHEYSGDRRTEQLRAARRRLAHLIAAGHAAIAIDGDALAIADRIEQDVLPPIGGLLRWLETRARGERRSR